MTNARREDYWDSLEASQKTILEAIEQVEGKDGWTIHSVVLSGESSNAVFGCVIRSKHGDNGLLLSERMVRIPDDMSDPDDLDMLDQRIVRRVSGPIAQALARGYARASNDRLAADDEDDPLTLSALGAEVSDGDRLTDTLADDPHESIRDSETETHECINCGGSVSEQDGINIGGALGTDKWVHSNDCEGGD